MQLTGCASPKWGRSPGFLAFFLDLLPGMREPSPIQIRFLLAQGVRQRLPVSAGVDGIQHRQRAAPSKEEAEKEAEDGARENAHRSFVAILSLLLLYAACLTPRRTSPPANISLRVPIWARPFQCGTGRTIIVTIHISRAVDSRQNAFTGVAGMSREQLRAWAEIGGSILLLSLCLLFFFPFG